MQSDIARKASKLVPGYSKAGIGIRAFAYSGKAFRAYNIMYSVWFDFIRLYCI